MSYSGGTQPPRSSIGGAAGEYGSLLRADLAAWFLAHGSCGRQVAKLGLERERAIPASVQCETDHHVDDICVTFRAGNRAFIQCKARLTFDRMGSTGGPFQKCVMQWERQYRADLGPEDRLVLACVDASNQIRALASALDRRRDDLASTPTRNEQNALAALRQWLPTMSREEQDDLFDRAVVLILTLGDDGAGDSGLAAELLQQGSLGALDGRAAFRALRERCRLSAALRSGIHTDRLRALLADDGIVLNPKRRPTRATVHVRHPYLLLQGALVGRQEDLSTLEALRSEIDAGGVVFVTGLAGMGKSALTWQTFRDAMHTAEEGSHIVWYSFYESEADFEDLIAYLADALDVPMGKTMSRTIDDVTSRLASTRCTIFLDGFERLISFYQRVIQPGDLGVSHIDDDTAPNDAPMSIASEYVRRFLFSVLSFSQCQIIASSRLVPSDFVASAEPVRGVKVMYLQGLDDDGAQALVEPIIGHVPVADLSVLNRQLAGHPFAWKVLAGMLRTDVAVGGNLRSWLDERGMAGDISPQALRHRVYQKAVASVSESAAMLLAAVGALGGTLQLTESRKQGLASVVNPSQFDECVSELLAMGLAAHESEHDILATHPLAIGAASERLGPEAIAALVALLLDQTGNFQRIEGQWGPGYRSWFFSRRGRSEATSLCQGLLALGQYAEAASLYLAELDEPIRLCLGVNHDAAAMLEEILFGLPAGFAQESGIRQSLAYHYICLDRPERAMAALDSAASLSAYAVALRAEAAVAAGQSDRAKNDFVVAMRKGVEDLLRTATQTSEPPAVYTVRALACRDLTEIVARCASALVGSQAFAHAAAALEWQFVVLDQSHRCPLCVSRLLIVVGELFLATGRRSLAHGAASEAMKLAEEDGKPVYALHASVTAFASRTDDARTGKARKALREEILQQESICGRLGFVVLTEALRNLARKLDGEEAGSLIRRHIVPFTREDSDEIAEMIFAVSVPGKLRTPRDIHRYQSVDQYICNDGVRDTLRALAGSVAVSPREES